METPEKTRKEKMVEYSRKSYLKNIEKKRNRYKNLSEEQKEIEREKSRKRYIPHPRILKDPELMKKEQAERAKKWQKENPEKGRENQARYRKNNLEKVRKYTREYLEKWRKENPEKYKAIEERYKPKQRERAKIYTKESRPAGNLRESKRRALKRKGIVFGNDQKKELEFFQLARDLQEKTGMEYAVDHIFPLSKGGPHHHDNLQVIKKSLNLQKNNNLNFKHPDLIHWSSLPQHVLEMIGEKDLENAWKIYKINVSGT